MTTPHHTPFDFRLISKSGMTQDQFARLVGVSRPTVSLWVNAHAYPAAHHNGRLAAAARILQTWIDDGMAHAHRFERNKRAEQAIGSLAA